MNIIEIRIAVDVGVEPWTFRLHIGQLPMTSGDGKGEARALFSGDRWSNVERSDVHVIFHFPIDPHELLLFQTIDDFEGP